MQSKVVPFNASQNEERSWKNLSLARAVVDLFTQSIGKVAERLVQVYHQAQEQPSPPARESA
jgi:hypothetical protein